jgi:Flp pilus assembly protein TadG
MVTKSRSLLDRFLRDERGAPLVEIALVLPVGIILTFGSFDIGRAIVYHHNIDTSLRSAARYMARLPETVVVDQARTRNLVFHGVWTANAQTGPRVTDPGTVLTTDLLCTACLAGPNRMIRLDMRVQYTFQLLNVLGINPTFTFEVSHEQPYIGG